MPTPMTSEQWARFVLPIVRKEWYQRMAATPSPVSSLFGIESSSSSVEYSQGIGQFGLVPEYDSADAEGQPAAIAYDSFSPLYEKTFTHKEYAKGMAIKRKLWDDGRTGLIQRRARDFGYSFGTTLATHAASVFNNAFSTSYLGSDAKALCADDHPNRADDTSTTFDNKGTSALSYSAIVSTVQAGKRLTDDRGNPMPAIYNTLVLPIELEATAIEILQAVAKPGAADHDANAARLMTSMNIVVDPYLSDANNWFMVDSLQSREHLLWFWRVRPEFAIDPSGDFNLEARYRGYMRYSYGWDDWRFIYGHEVA